MAAVNSIHSGSTGTVYVGSTAVASIRSFSFEETQETIDATTMNVGGVAFRTNKPTFKSWSGTVDIYWTTQDDDETPGDYADGNAVLTPGATEVTIHFWPQGDDEHELGYYGTALITSRSISSSVDGMVEASVSVIGTGPISTENGSA
jgi:hypothetical protein